MNSRVCPRRLVGHSLVYPPFVRWALRPEFQLWPGRAVCVCVCGQQPHFLASSACVHWAFFKMANKARVTGKNGQQIVHSASEKPKIHFPPTHTHTECRCRFLLFHSVCVCVWVCVWAWLTVKHLLNLILPGWTASARSAGCSPGKNSGFNPALQRVCFS